MGIRRLSLPYGMTDLDLSLHLEAKMTTLYYGMWSVRQAYIASVGIAIRYVISYYIFSNKTHNSYLYFYWHEPCL